MKKIVLKTAEILIFLKEICFNTLLIYGFILLAFLLSIKQTFSLNIGPAKGQEIVLRTLPYTLAIAFLIYLLRNILTLATFFNRKFLLKK